MANIINKPDSSQSFGLTQGKLTTKSSGFKQRINQATASANAVDPQTMPNRICLMLDCSGSMDAVEVGTQRRIDLLKDAVQNFVSRCNFRDTSVAISTFPQRSDKAMPLTSQSSVILAYSMGLEPNGGTPLRSCVVSSLEDVAMTRGVIVSDGGATDWRHYEDDVEHSSQPQSESLLQTYKEQGIPLDCVHISTTSDGEELLRKIASATGGIFMKFSDVNAFSKAFGFLAPATRAMLTSDSVTARDLGAKEIK